MAKNSAALQPGAITMFAGGNADIARALQIRRDFFAESGDSGDGAITVFAIRQSFCGRLDDRCTRMEIRLTQFQMNNGSALAFQFLGVSKD